MQKQRPVLAHWGRGSSEEDPGLKAIYQAGRIQGPEGPCSPRYAHKPLLGGGGNASLFGEGGGFVCGLPGEAGLGAAEVAVCRGLAVDGTAQVEALDDAFGSEREVFADELG